MVMQRYLDDIEEHFINRRACFAVEYRGDIDEESLNSALHWLCVRHPVLRGRIQTDDRGPLVRVHEGDYPQLQVVADDGSDLLSHALKGDSPSDLVARVILVRGESEGHVLFTVNHSVCARNVLSRMSDLWRLYTDIVNGVEVSVERGRSLPYSSRYLLNNVFGKIELASPPRDVIVRSETPKYVHLYGIQLTSSDTRRLRTVARAGRVSLERLIQGEISIALHLSESTMGPRSMKFLSCVDLQPYLSSPIADSDITYLVGGLVSSVSVSADADPIDIASRLNSGIAEGIRSRRNIYLPAGAQWADYHDSVDCSVNNAGNIRVPPHPVGLEFITVKPLVRAGFRNGCEVPPPFTRRVPYVGTRQLNKVTINLYAVDGAMRILLFCSMVPDVDNGIVVDTFEARLRKIYDISPVRYYDL